MTFHYTEPSLLNPAHRVTVDLIGLGGTGSQALTMLGRLHSTLQKLGHAGLYVRGWDPDTVSESNIGRQMFSPPEIGYNKAVALMTRINRFCSTDWEAMPELFSAKRENDHRTYSNITISCVDTIKARKDIFNALKLADAKLKGQYEPMGRPFYWMDFGNGQKTGQAVLGTVLPAKQPDTKDLTTDATGKLKNIFQLRPDLKKQKDEDSGPSCSVAEAIHRQDLFINSTLCNLGMQILWSLFRELRIRYHGVYLNLETLASNPIKI